MPIIEYESGQNLNTKLHKDTIAIDKATYLNEIVYNADGRNPIYNHNAGLKLINLPKGVTVTASCNSGQPSTNNYKQTITIVAATNPSEGTPTEGSVTVLYETEILTVSFSKDEGSGDLSTPTITVKNGNTTIGTLHNGDSLKVAYSINYVCSASQLEGYFTPESVTKNWSNTTTKSLTFKYLIDKGVDLGLPSGTKWASGNIISNGNGGYKIGEETDYGAYVSWGNVTPHFAPNGTFENGYNFGNSNSGVYASTPGAKITSPTGTGATFSPTSGYDAARELLGSPWKIPTATQWSELVSNTTSVETTKNGIKGYEFTSTRNGKKIFLPFVGYGVNTAPNTRGSRAYYASSSLKDANYPYCMVMYTGGTITPNYATSYRCYGYGVRAVQ